VDGIPLGDGDGISDGLGEGNGVGASVSVHSTHAIVITSERSIEPGSLTRSRVG